MYHNVYLIFGLATIFTFRVREGLSEGQIEEREGVVRMKGRVM